MQDIEEIYKQHSKTVYKYLFCLTNNKELSEDITQETFEIAVEEIVKFKGNCKVSVWLCQIAKHLLYKELKKKNIKSISFAELENEIVDNYEIEDVVLDNEDKLQLFKNLQVLDEKTRDVIYLRILGNLTFNEIAEVLGKTSNWARTVFYRGKQKMKEANKNGKEN